MFDYEHKMAYVDLFSYDQHRDLMSPEARLWRQVLITLIDDCQKTAQGKPLPNMMNICSLEYQKERVINDLYGDRVKEICELLSFDVKKLRELCMKILNKKITVRVRLGQNGY